MFSSADQLAGTFASFFLDAIVANDLNSIQGMFAQDASFVLVDGAAQKSYAEPNERTATVNQIVGAVVSANFNVESVSGAEITNGVLATVLLSVSADAYTQRWFLAAVLEKIHEDVFCVRQLTITFFPQQEVAASPAAVQQQAPAAAAVAAPSPNAAASGAQAPEPAAVSPPQSPEKLCEAPAAAPAVESAKAKRTMKKNQKAAATAAAAAAPPAAEEEAPAPQPAVVAPVEEPVAVPEPVVEEAPAPAPVPEPVQKPAPAAAAPKAAAAAAKPSSWASMARDNKTAQPSGKTVPIRVSPPPEGGLAAEPAPVPEAASARPARPAREPRPAPVEVLDKVMFPIAKLVSEEEVKAALGTLAASAVSIRIVEAKKLVFIDFSIANAIDVLKSNPPTIGGAKINPYKQRAKE